MMKYTYAYKTSDGVRHEDAMEAGSREEVFVRLRERGIKAIKVVAADGSRANGENAEWRMKNGEHNSTFYILHSALAIAAVAAIALGAWWLYGVRGAPALPGEGPSDFLVAGTRRQVIGDPAVIEKGIRSGWADVFGREGERFLASFAIPGVKAGQRSTREEEIRSVLDQTVAPEEGDSIEARQIKAMVEGMKREARRYIAAGGTIVGYGRRLVERQEAEIAIYGRVRAEAEAKRGKMAEEEFEAFLEKRNDELRNLGIKPVVFEN